MGSYQRGTTITLQGNFTDGRTGTYIDPDSGSKSLTIYKDGVVIKSVTDAEIVKLDTGKYYYEWDTEDTLEKGLYGYEFKAKVNGKDVVESGLLRIRARKRG